MNQLLSKSGPTLSPSTSASCNGCFASLRPWASRSRGGVVPGAISSVRPSWGQPSSARPSWGQPSWVRPSSARPSSARPSWARPSSVLLSLVLLTLCNRKSWPSEVRSLSEDCADVRCGTRTLRKACLGVYTLWIQRLSTGSASIGIASSKLLSRNAISPRENSSRGTSRELLRLHPTACVQSQVSNESASKSPLRWR